MKSHKPCGDKNGVIHQKWNELLLKTNLPDCTTNPNVENTTYTNCNS